MLLLYTDDTPSSRLQYCMNFLFKEALSLDYKVTSSMDAFNAHDGPKLAYGKTKPQSAPLFIKKHDFIDEQGVELPKVLQIQRWKKTTILFYNQPGKKIPFDIFSAIFLLISRIEEYNSPYLDAHQRFDYQRSIAFEYGFLEEPIIDIWIIELKKILEKELSITINMSAPEIKITFDLDMALKYAHLSTWKRWSHQVVYTTRGRLSEMKNIGKSKKNYNFDPYISVWKDLLKVIPQPADCFILLSEGHKFDTNVPLNQFDYPTWIKEYQNKLQFQIHPSYKGHESPKHWKKEIEFLDQATESDIKKSRFHFIKYQFPKSFQQLIELGIEEDYSMGYGAINGYRASTSRSFYWYDLSKEEVTSLKIHPFNFMDSSAFFHEKKSTEDAFMYLQKQLLQAINLSTPMITIWHNYLLANQKEWLNMYQRFVDLMKSNRVL